jgi:hypothetical protein
MAWSWSSRLVYPRTGVSKKDFFEREGDVADERQVVLKRPGDSVSIERDNLARTLRYATVFMYEGYLA